jgi:hypothetical protein
MRRNRHAAQRMREAHQVAEISRGATLAARRVMLPSLRVYDYVNQPFARVAEALSRDTPGILQRATTVAGERAAELGAKLHAHVGPVDVTANVAVEIGPMDDTPLASGREALRIPIAWQAARTKGAFPVMRAELTIYPLTSTETQLELAGTYEPPLGAIGRALDSALLHRIAEASVLQFVQEVARYMRAS